MDDKELFLKALDNAVYWQNHCVCLEEIIEMFCLDAEEAIKHSQRTWIGLTDEDDIDWEEGGNLKDLVKAIEAKLKEKNGY